MTTSDKLATKIAQLIIRGEIDPAKVKHIEKKVGVKLNLSAEQMVWATLVYANRHRMTLITAWVGGQSCPEIGNINRFEDEDNPVEKMKESVDFWMNHALVEE